MHEILPLFIPQFMTYMSFPLCRALCMVFMILQNELAKLNA